MWHNWDIQEWQWKNMLQINDPTDRIPFFNSTYIQVGNGRNTPFWKAKWIQGAAPKDLAPGLFKSARFKK
jgi:hypothetical protein